MTDKKSIASQLMEKALESGFEVAKEIINPTPKFEGYKDVYIQTKLDVGFGEYESASDWVKDLDDELATSSFFAIKAIKENKAYEWDDCVAALNNSDGLVQLPDSHRAKIGEFHDDTNGFFKVDGTPDSSLIKKLETIFKKTCDEVDPNIFNNSTLVEKGVINRLAEISAQTGARVSNFGKLFYATDSHSEKVLEISIIRFPDKENPHVQLFRIVVDAWFSCTRVAMAETNSHGFVVDVNSIKFKMNEAIKTAITDNHVDKFKEKLSQPGLFDF